MGGGGEGGGKTACLHWRHVGVQRTFCCCKTLLPTLVFLAPRDGVVDMMFMMEYYYTQCSRWSGVHDVHDAELYICSVQDGVINIYAMLVLG